MYPTDTLSGHEVIEDNVWIGEKASIMPGAYRERGYHCCQQHSNPRCACLCGSRRNPGESNQTIVNNVPLGN